ncbi:MAG: sodium:solute symporter family protein [Deltaproteobacteria bacterium]|nr:sodium:solute symporter family protein [Deltaproteobacteria bacterium]
MHPVDLAIFIVYMAAMLAIGYHFLRKNTDAEDYYVGGRSMGAWHVGFSVVATDVGGGFSIGLGGLGFAMGLSGSWMLATGLLGAWLSAVVLIPRIKRDPAFAKALTFPEIFAVLYDKRVAVVAGLISAVGYLGFTSSQILAGAKLASGTFVDLDQNTALLIMGLVAVGYTVMGGLKAVIYTDTVQWAVLMFGLILVGLPVAYLAVGGWEVIEATLPAEMFSLTNLSWQKMVNWFATILPIWFVGMTLYQRIYACADERTAKKAWYLAGLLEYPVMAFMGVMLGLLARVAADQGMFAYLGSPSAAGMDAETGLPMLLRTALPVGLLGIMMSAYFSAILSTADSCLMASSGNVVSDILGTLLRIDSTGKRFLRLSQLSTLVIGALALLLATCMTSVLSLMLYSYAFLVSGLLVPVIGALFWKRRSPTAAIAAMLVGGTTTVVIEVGGFALWGLDGNVFGIAASAVVFVSITDISARSQGRS